MNSGKDKENVKQKVPQNLYNALINESKETNQNVQPNSISKNCKKLNEICTQNKFDYPKYTVLRIKTSSKDSTYIAICFINNIKQIGMANSIKTAKDFAAIKIINSLSQKDEKCEHNLINSLEHLHVTIQESSINDPKPSMSSQITKPITSNNNRDKNTNSYKMKKILIILHHLPLQKDLKNVLNADIDLPTSTINSNINIPYRFRKSTTMEHYCDEPTHVPTYYFLEEISFTSRQTRNITNISKTNDPFLQQIQKVHLELRMRHETSLYWPKENLFLLPNPFFQKDTNLSSKLDNIITYITDVTS